MSAREPRSNRLEVVNALLTRILKHAIRRKNAPSLAALTRRRFAELAFHPIHRANSSGGPQTTRTIPAQGGRSRRNSGNCGFAKMPRQPTGPISHRDGRKPTPSFRPNDSSNPFSIIPPFNSLCRPLCVPPRPLRLIPPAFVAASLPHRPALGHLALQLLLHPREHVRPVANRSLPEQPHRRIPRIVRALEQPPPLRTLGRGQPHRHA